MGENFYPIPLSRAEAFADRLGIRLPILLAPLADAGPPSSSIAVADAGTRFGNKREGLCLLFVLRSQALERNMTEVQMSNTPCWRRPRVPPG